MTGQALASPTPSDETKLKLDHIMKEVAGTEITVTKTTSVPAKIPAYWTLDFSAEYYLTKNCRLTAGVSNLTDQRYYSRVFGSRIEPAPGINGYGGISIGF